VKLNGSQSVRTGGGASSTPSSSTTGAPGFPFLHPMTGNLSFQIEHHLFPDLPSNRYQEIAPKVQELFERNGLTSPGARTGTA
jgi:fatty acid desaturase